MNYSQFRGTLIEIIVQYYTPRIGLRNLWFFLNKLNEDIYNNVSLPFRYRLKDAVSLTAKPCII
jgi:hypothetical protein